MARSMFHLWSIYVLVLSQLHPGAQGAHSPSASLDLVFGLFRHGDRAPLTTYPKDTNRNSEKWVLGFGELTQRGMQTMLELGSYLNHRYDKFLKKDPKETNMRSSPKTRCFNSAALVLYEMYPAKWPREIDGNNKWFPFPITRVPENHDKYTLKCLSEIKKLTQEVLNPKGSYGGMGKFLLEAAQQLGLQLPAQAAAMPDALDSLLVQKENGLTLPRWFEERIDTISYISRGVYVLMANAFMKNMGGQLLRDIAQYVEERYNLALKSSGVKPHSPEKIEARKETRLQLFSYHDLNIIAVLMALEATFSEKPYYGSIVLFEVWNEAQGHYIRALYRNGTNNLRDISLMGCSVPCKVDKFIKLVRGRFPKDFTPTECGYPEGYVVL